MSSDILLYLYCNYYFYLFIYNMCNISASHDADAWWTWIAAINPLCYNNESLVLRQRSGADVAERKTEKKMKVIRKTEGENEVTFCLSYLSEVYHPSSPPPPPPTPFPSHLAWCKSSSLMNLQLSNSLPRGARLIVTIIKITQNENSSNCPFSLVSLRRCNKRGLPNEIQGSY